MRQPFAFALSVFGMIRFSVRKDRIFRKPGQLERSDRAIALLGQDDLRDILILGIMIVIVFALEEHDDIGVLFDRTRFTKIGEHRSFDLSFFDRAREL